MVASIPTETEKSIICEVLQKACSAVPGAQVRFVKREQDPNEKGILIGIQLPGELPSNSNSVFKLHDLCVAESRERDFSIGLSVNQPLGTTGLLDLGFLPAGVVAPLSPGRGGNVGLVPGRKLAITAAAVVLIMLVALFMQNQKVIKEAFHVGDQTEQISNKNKGTGIGQPAHQQNEEVNRASYDTTQHEVTAGKKDLSPGRSDLNSTTTPRDNYAFNQGSNTTGTAPNTWMSKQQDLRPNDEASARKRTVDELLNYISVLRSSGHINKVEKVEQIMQELP